MKRKVKLIPIINSGKIIKLKPIRALSKIIDLTGKRFGEVTVLNVVGTGIKHRCVYWLVQCDCGNRFYAQTHNLKAGHISKCRQHKREYIKTLECIECKKEKLVSEFYQVNQKRGHNSWYPRCKICQRNFENEKSKADRKRDPVKYAEQYLKKRYGIDFKDYHKIRKQQGDKCAICGTPSKKVFQSKLHVDHDHDIVPIKVRGLLCNFCNMGLGAFKDNIKFLNNAIKYLNRSSN